MPTLLEKIWRDHQVSSNNEGQDLLYADRHLVHEVTSPQAFAGLRESGRKVRRPDLTFAVMDHVTPTDNGRCRPLQDKVAENLLAALERNCEEFGISLWGMDSPRQGVIHVSMPEAGIILPGNTVFCGDSHTATGGAFGALAFGIGTSEVEHILATQCLPQTMPKTLKVEATGSLQRGVYAKDLILAIINTLGFGGGTGHVIEYCGPAIEQLSMEGRMTVCNMSIECGAKAGFIAPDRITLEYLKGRPCAPKGEDFERAAAYWETLKSDGDADFDRQVSIDASGIAPQVTWGTNPAQSCGINDKLPDPDSMADPEERSSAAKALKYMGLEPGAPIAGLPVDLVFIGSCTNGRLSDLEAAAEVIKGRKVADGLPVLVVPGSGQVKAQAEAQGLDKVFTEAGCQWRMPGCSMCLAMNPDVLGPGMRSASTSNRNFEGRQGRDSRTHLMSPAMAAAAAVTGRITDVRELLD